MAALLVLSTAPSLSEARRLADLLLKKHLAACVSLSSPVESRYRWKGRQCRDREIMLFIKTDSRVYNVLEKTLLKEHPYDCPEILGFPAQKGSSLYRKWLESETKLNN